MGSPVNTDAGRATIAKGSLLKTALVINSGSSSLKFGVYRQADMGTVLHGAADFSLQTGSGESGFWVTQSDGGHKQFHQVSTEDHEALAGSIANLLASQQIKPDVIAHRVVHGGPHVRDHCLIRPQILQHLSAADIYAPLHNDAALAVIAAMQTLFPGVQQVACLDTAFHAGMPEVARVFPLMQELRLEGIERYGFHGISCESIVHALGDELPERLVIAHLGSGASITAVQSGRSIDTSMGLTPASGVPMSTRSGDLDPGVLLYLLREKKYDAARLERVLNKRSGLLGISRLSGDMRKLREAAAQDADAALAIDIFCYAIRKQIAAMAAALGGIDMLVFAGGIGEHDAQTRAQISEGLAWLGLDTDLTRHSSRIKIVPSREEEQMARHAFRLTAA